MSDFQRALDVKLEANDANASDVRVYLAELLFTVLDEEEGFSGKRPFGNGGWLHDIIDPLEAAGFSDAGTTPFLQGLVGELCNVEWGE